MPRRKAELEEELDQLRHQYEKAERGQTSTVDAAPSMVSVSSLPLGTSISSDPTPQNAWYGGPSPPNLGTAGRSLLDNVAVAGSSKSSSWTTPQNFPAFQSPVPVQITADATSLPNLSPKACRNSLPTTPRSLGDTDLSPQKIRDCFALHVNKICDELMFADMSLDSLSITPHAYLESMITITTPM
jgi:hypothetical protein